MLTCELLKIVLLEWVFHLQVHHLRSRYLRRQTAALDALRQELQMVVSYHVVVGNQSRSQIQEQPVCFV